MFFFRNGGSPLIYFGSADLMERNFDSRVEVIAPVKSPELLTHLRDKVLDAYLRDTVNARELREDGSYHAVPPAKNEQPFDAQRWFIDLYRAGSPFGPATDS